MPAPRSLTELEADISRDLELVAHPRAAWLEAKTSGGAPVLDCLIIGAGQCGLAVAHALKRDKVANILLLDRAPEGKEGPWVTYARMPTLRSWKDQNGPDLGISSLTYQAWHEAQFGAAHFAAMRMIPREALAKLEAGDAETKKIKLEKGVLRNFQVAMPLKLPGGEIVFSTTLETDIRQAVKVAIARTVIYSQTKLPDHYLDCPFEKDKQRLLYKA